MLANTQEKGIFEHINMSKNHFIYIHFFIFMIGLSFDV